MKRLRFAALATAAGALLIAPTVGDAHHRTGHTKGGNGTSKRCKKPTVNKGFVVKGTLTSYTADTASTTDVNEAVVGMTVTGANRHARKAGVEKGETYTADGTPGASGRDAFTVQLSDFEALESPEVNEDKVRVVGKISVPKRRCGSSTTTGAGDLDDVNIRKVKIIDVD
jgi:hypothetical protein